MHTINQSNIIGQITPDFPPLLLVHGFLGGKAQWNPILSELQKSHTIIAPDLPGFGADITQDSPDQIRGFAESLWRYLDELGVTECDILGHSMGGMIVQEMAHLAGARIRRLVCYGTGPLGAMPKRFEPLDVSRERFKTEGVAATAGRIAATWFCEGEEAEHYRLCQELGTGVKLKNALAGLHAMEAWDGRDYLTDIACPTLVIAGENDRSYARSYINSLAEHIPNSELVILENCSHNAHLEQSKKFMLIVAKFLNASYS